MFDKTKKISKYIVYVILVSIAAIIQNTPNLTIEIFDCRCFLLVPLVLIIGMGEDELASALLGLLGGAILDLSSGTHMGFNAIYLTLICYICSSLITYIFRNKFITNMVFITVSTLLYVLIYWLFFIVFKGYEGVSLSIFYFYLPSALYTIVCSPIIYFSVKPIKRFLNKTEVEITE